MAKLWLAVACAITSLSAAAAPPAARLERGKYLTEGILACANCHGARDEKMQIIAARGLSGGRLFDFPMFKAYAPNITNDPATGVGKWSDAQLGRAIREGLRPDGSVIGPPMPVHFYRVLADSDLAAVIAYLRAQPAVSNVVPKSTYNIALPPNYGPPLKQVKAPPRKENVAYGKYLVTIGHCMECHTPRDEKGMLVEARLGAGGQVFNGPWGMSTSRNLTAHAEGLRDWSDAQVAAAIRSGKDRSGASYKPPMAFDWYRSIDDADMAAMVSYLRSLPPLGTEPQTAAK
jgi:mono/diheme cytochrome c family protein